MTFRMSSPCLNDLPTVSPTSVVTPPGSSSHPEHHIWEDFGKPQSTAKILLHKIVSPHPLQFRELYTLLTEVEATLNSRPLTPLYSSDADGHLTLTPGHFLVGRPILAPPSHLASQVKLTNLRRWQLIQRLAHDFWVAWKSKYLQYLQRRDVWQSGHHNFREGDTSFSKMTRPLDIADDHS